jgi:HlyD family secretion protein
MKRRTILMIGICALTLAATAIFFTRSHSAKAPEFVTVPAGSGDIRTVVNATGTVQPVVSVQVGTQVSGQVLEIYADFNSVVKRGQTLARIDPRNFEAQVTNAQARVQAARSALHSAQAGGQTAAADITSSKAGVSEAQAVASQMSTLYARAQELSEKGLIAKNDLDMARANAETAQAKLRQANAAVEQSLAKQTGSGAQTQQMRAQLAQAEADLKQAQINLGYTNIVSPVDGVVISRNVDVGQTIAASLQAPTLFTIANDLTRMQLNASIDEADIGNISSSADARFTVDAFPNESFRARIHEVRLSPTTVQNVVTYSAILDIDNPELKLKPGMTANINITVDRRDRVLKVPNAALRYTPPGMTAERPEPVKTVNDASQRAAPAADPSPSILAPGQKWDPAEKIQLDRPKKETLRSGRVWVLGADGKPSQRPVVLGITDGTSSEVVSGELNTGEAIIVGDTSQTEPASKNAVRIPFIPVPRGRGMR